MVATFCGSKCPADAEKAIDMTKETGINSKSFSLTAITERITVIQESTETTPQEETGNFLERLRNSNPNLRKESLSRLPGTLTDEELFPILIKFASGMDKNNPEFKETDFFVRDEAIYILSTRLFSSPGSNELRRQGVETLIIIAKNEDEEEAVRESAIEGLGRSGFQRDRIIRAIRPLKRHPTLRVRAEEAIIQLGG